MCIICDRIQMIKDDVNPNFVKKRILGPNQRDCC